MLYIDKGISIAYGRKGEGKNEIGIIRKLRPSRLHEMVLLRKARKYMYGYFIIAYGEVELLKALIEKAPPTKFDRVKARLYRLIEEDRREELEKYLSNKLLEYERKLFYSLTS